MVFQFPSSKREMLCFWRNAFLVSNFCFYVLNGVICVEFYRERDGILSDGILSIYSNEYGVPALNHQL